MKSNIPWSVKGIDPEAREAAKVAARRAGMTLGEWLNSLILQSGELPEGLAQQLGALVDEDEDSDENGVGASDESSDAADELQTRLENLNRKLDQSERQQLTVSGIDESIERLASTIESSRRLLASGESAQRAISDLSHRVERIHARLEEVAQQHRSGIEPKTLMALERAIAGVATHIEKSDRRNTELVQSVEDALSQLGTRVDGAESIANDAVGRIDLALDRLGNRIDTAESEQRRSAARLNERLAQIDERLAHAGVERETTLGTVERRLASFETKLQSLQSRMETAAAAAIRPNIPPDVITRMEFEDWSRRQASDLTADTSSIKRSVSAIEARLSGVMDRIDRLRQDTESQVHEVERKAEEALQHSAIQAKSTDGQTAAAIGEVRESVDEIAQRFDRSNHTTTETMSALEGVLRSLTRRLDALENRPTRTAESAAPNGTQQEPAPVGVSDLPKRPTWSWGTARQVVEPPPAAPEVEAIIEEPEEAAATPATAGERGLRAEAKGAKDVVEVITEPMAPSPEVDRGEDEEIIEATFSPEEQAANAAGVDFDRDDIDVESETVAQDEDREGGAGGVDLSNLVFNLKGAREPAPEAEDWRSNEDAWRDRSERVEPTLDTEPAEEAASGSGAWLDQARRAAKAAGPGERVSDFQLDDEERSPARAILITLVVLVLLIAVAAAGWFFVRPWLAKSNLLGSAPMAETAPSAAAKAPTEGGPGATQPSSPSTSRSAAELGEPGYAPAESDIGQPLPGEESAEPSLETGTEGEAATPDGLTAPSTTENAAPEPPQTGAETPASAADAMKAAANSGNARAQYALALAYKSGRGAPADAARALDLMKQAADKNLAVAQRALGIWYEQGDGVREDITQARSWYEKAAKNGDVQGMHNLGYFYAEGKGGLTKDGAAAERWFKEAAEKGLVASQVNLAIIYSQSDYDMTPRMDQAYFWSAVAAKSGDVEAERMRVALASTLSADAKSRMDQDVQNWKSKPVDVVANGGFDSSPDAFLPANRQPELTRAELTSVQEMLNKLGFDAGTADGRPGSQTEAAIKSFQAAYGLQQTGIANRDLLAALNAIPH